MIVMPGFVYAPHDRSAVGDVLRRLAAGQLPALPFASLGFSAVHRDDVVAGTLLALDRGTAGQSYHLGGEITTMGEVVATAARLLGRRGPRITIPDAAMRAIAPLGPVLAPLTGFPPNLHEAIRGSAGVTYWGTRAKATAELGYAPRGLEDGLRETFVAEGWMNS
jgi:dihydroflavonol-4-reductase